MLAANLGTAALIFSFTPFVTQIGLQFWFLAGAVQAIATPSEPRPALQMSTWLLVSGDFTPYGGMDMANFALASYLARDESAASDVHLVSHRVSPELAALPRVHVHTVRGRSASTRWASRSSAPPPGASSKPRVRRALRTLANGGNADLGDLNWVHYVHAAFDPPAAGFRNRLRVAWNHKRYVADERQALGHARLVICNSNRTADDVVKLAASRAIARGSSTTASIR